MAALRRANDLAAAAVEGRPRARQVRHRRRRDRRPMSPRSPTPRRRSPSTRPWPTQEAGRCLQVRRGHGGAEEARGRIDKAELMALGHRQSGRPGDRHAGGADDGQRRRKGSRRLGEFAEDDRPADDRGARHRALRRANGSRHLRRAAPHEAKNMKGLYKTFADGATRTSRPSVSSRSRIPIRPAGSGAWGPGGAVTLSGRPGDHKQDLGTEHDRQGPERRHGEAAAGRCRQGLPARSAATASTPASPRCTRWRTASTIPRT